MYSHIYPQFSESNVIEWIRKQKKKRNRKANHKSIIIPRHVHVDTPQFDNWASLNTLTSPSSYLLRSSALSWIHCPCLETRWNKAEPWSHTQSLSWVQRGRRYAQRGPSRPASARVLVKAALMSACTELCNPGWTGTDDPPEKVNDGRLFHCKKRGGFVYIIWVSN